MPTPEFIALVAATFLVGGFVKGVVGFGLPTVALAILAATRGLEAAMALMLIPSLATNLWQAVVGDALAAIVRRLWPLFAAVCVGVWVGTTLLVAAAPGLLVGGLGALLCVYGATSLATPQIRPPGRHERWLSPLVGAVNGTVTGLTGTFVVPGTLYLQALGLARDALVQAMGALYLLSTAALAVALARHELVTVELATASAVALVPALAGMAIGQRVRHRLPEARFRRIFFSALLALGLYLLGRSALTLG